MKVISEVHTVAEPTDGETPSAVSIRTASGPVGFGTTTQGCRPISVKIQPKELAKNGATTTSVAARANQRCTGRPRRVPQRPASASRIVTSPRPIISRNDQ